MPNVAGLTILLGADFTSAEQAMDRFNGKVSQFVNQMQSLFASAGVNVQQFNNSFQSFEKTSSSVASSLGNTNSVANQMINTTQKLGSGFGSLQLLANRSVHGVADLFISPYRAMLIFANDIPQFVNRIREIKQAEGEAASYSSIFASALNPLGIAISIGLTALIKYTPEIYKWATGADSAAEKTKALKKEQDELNQITENANKSAGEQIGTIETLNATMTNNKLSMEQRTNAYNEALKLYPSYLEGVSKDSALNGGLADIINTKLIPAILAAAQARALNDKIAKLSAENIDLEDKQALAVINTGKAYSQLQKAKADAAKVSPTDNPEIIKAYYAEVDIADQKYRKAIQTQEDLMGQIGTNTDSMRRYAGSIQQAATSMGHLDMNGKDIATLKYGTDSKSKKTAQEQLDDILKSMQTSIDKTNLDLSNKLIDPAQADKRITQAIDAAIAKVKQLNIPDKDTIIAKLMGEIPKSGIDLNELKGVKLDKDGDLGIEQQYLNGIENIKKANQDVSNIIEKNIFLPMSESATKGTEKYLEQNKKDISELNKQFKDTVGNWDGIIGQPIKTFYSDLLHGKSVFKDLAKSFEEMIANMAAKATEAGIISLILGGKYDGKTGGKSVFSSVFDSLLGGKWGGENPVKSASAGYSPTTDYGQPNFSKSKAIGDAAMSALSLLDNAHITANTTNNIANATIGQDGGTGSTIASIAGTALKLLPLALTFLADGGIVTSPTLAMVGEAGKEAVIPLDKLNQFTNNGNSMTVNVVGKTSGRDLYYTGINYDTYRQR